MTNYTNLFNPSQTPQNEQIPGTQQVLNNAGGYVFQLDIWARLERFLILGADSATYYQNAKELTRENALVVMDCWTEDATRTAQTIGDISWNGRAPKQSPAIFALALGAIHTNENARKASYHTVQRVCRTASHLFEWLETCRSLGKGTGRGMKRVLANWYAERDNETLAYQAIKYRQRNGYTHKRVIELSNKGAGENIERRVLYRWMRGKDNVDYEELPSLVQAHIRAMEMSDKELPQLITRHRLPWEALPTEALNTPAVWRALTPHLGLTALIRNLGNMTACGAIAPMDFEGPIVERLTDETALRKSRIHPFSVLQALAVYKQGHGFKGSKTWGPVGRIINALDEAFYKSFANVVPTNKRIMLALDVSGSMTSKLMNSPISCREASAALSLVTMSTEQNTMVVGFTSERGSGWRREDTTLTVLNISARQRLDDVVRSISNLPFGGTDCSLPMLYALENSISCDAFVVYTDNETWAGRMHPIQALKQYRQKTGINAKLVVVGMTATGSSIGDPADSGILDIVGFDSSCPALIADFIR